MVALAVDCQIESMKPGNCGLGEWLEAKPSLSEESVRFAQMVDKAWGMFQDGLFIVRYYEGYFLW